MITTLVTTDITADTRAVTDPMDAVTTAPAAGRGRWLRRSALASVALLGVAWGTSLGATPAHADAINTDTIEKSIVWVDAAWSAQVDVPFKDDTVKTYTTDMLFFCTGFFVSSDGYIATAGHCVEPSQAQVTSAKEHVIATLKSEGYTVNGTADSYNWKVTLSDPTLRVGQPNTPNRLPVFASGEIVARQVAHETFENGDNALLQLANVTGMPALPIATAKPATRDGVVYVGFPGNVQSVTDVNRQPPTFKDAKVSSLGASSQGVPIIQLDTAIAHGMSGGPCLNLQGQVIGINSAVFDATTESFVTDTDLLNAFLKRNGVAYLSAGATSTSAVTPSTSQSAQAPVVQSQVSTAPSSHSGGLNVAAIGVAAAVAAGGVGAGYAMSRRGRRAAAPASVTSAPNGTAIPFAQTPTAPGQVVHQQGGVPAQPADTNWPPNVSAGQLGPWTQHHA